MNNRIIDNHTRTVADFLRCHLKSGVNFSVVSAYFTIYAYDALQAELHQINRLRFLYGDPIGVGNLNPTSRDIKAYQITNDRAIEPKQALRQSPLAKECSKWVERSVDIRTISKANFLHGKLYHIANAKNTAAVVGSSNFTRRGLGLSTTSNVELNLEVAHELDRRNLVNWFDNLWNNEDLTRDAKSDVLQALARLGQNYSPEFVYYKTLFHIFEDRLDEHEQREDFLHDVHLYDSKIWKSLYDFQREGVISAINRLMRHQGCIVADSVGLGKTWLALAIIKFFELCNERVLVLCPKKLEDNWIRYTSLANYENNPFEQDRLSYNVLAHTDLSRYEGFTGQINLARFNWGAFDLIVIDESHNFRNEGIDQKDDDGNIIRRSRYNRLLEEVIKSGVRTKVLMLSATPVNTSLRDLRNQIYLMTEKRRDAFREDLGIDNIESMLGVAQRDFLEWERNRRATGILEKSDLFSQLGTEFLTLLDAVTIARSREHIRRFYPQVERKIGKFPARAKPVNLHPPSDSEGELSYDDLHQRISNFRLAVYMPSHYLQDTSILEATNSVENFDQRDREHWLIGMMRTNLLKRLESSVQSFVLTMSRILKKMEDIDATIEKWRFTNRYDTSVALTLENDDEDDEFTVGTGKAYPLTELNINAWQIDLDKDRQILQGIHDLAAKVTVRRDAKLSKLKQLLQEKIESPTVDKDGRLNRKVLVFTTFADTANYLYDNLTDLVQNKLGAHIAVVVGGDKNRTTVGKANFMEIIGRFSPNSQQTQPDNEIEILIATDCLSEGQNLQDCDMVVNYDIHWNPVRLMQRFGRIDRLGSRNHQVAMINFWPTENLDRYLDLQNRVEARMALADAAGTGLDNLLKEQTTSELGFRDEQLLRLRDEILDVEQLNDGVALSDFTLDDYIAELLNYLQQRREELERAPFGICGIVGIKSNEYQVDGETRKPTGAIFCFKQFNEPKGLTPNVLKPYFLVFVQDDGTIRYTFRHAKQCLDLFRDLAIGKDHARNDLIDAFDKETQNGRKMVKYNNLLTSALDNIRRTYQRAELSALGKGDRSAKLTNSSTKPSIDSNMELVTWLIIGEDK